MPATKSIGRKRKPAVLEVDLDKDDDSDGDEEEPPAPAPAMGRMKKKAYGQPPTSPAGAVGQYPP